ncbi:MAG: matrixin family metalloprotease [Vicinamibacterales bacterium]
MTDIRISRPVAQARSLAAVAFVAALAHGTAAAQPATATPGLIVRGRVSGAASRWDQGALYTYVTVEITRVVVGTGVPDRVVLKQLGGEVGGIGMWVAGQAAFRPDEDVLLDLEADRTGTLHTRGLARGKWRVERDPGTGVDLAVQAPGAGVDTRTRLASLEATLAANTPPLAAFVASPPEFSAAPLGPGAQYAYLPTDGGYPARWHEVDSGTTVPVDYPSSLPAGWPGSPSDATAAVNLWRNSGMDLDLAGAANLPLGQCPATFTGIGRIAVAYTNSCGAAIPDWVIGGGYYTTGDLRTVGGTTFQKFLQGFVLLGDSAPPSAGCFRDAITHGLGHALGLGHSSSAGAIMNAGPPSGCASGPSGLGADDLAGITAIYQGIPSGGNPPNTPTNFSVSAVLSSVTLSWTPASTGGAAQHYLVDAGTAPSTYNLGTAVVNAPQTTLTANDVPPGVYYLRVRAENVLGTSAPSPERSVTVGGCALPGAPATFTGSSNDMVVNLQWTPPAAGVVQGYRLVAGSAPGLGNLATVDLSAAVTSLQATAPYGTYYLRAHATNVCGISPPSAEIVLNVQPCTAPPAAPIGFAGSVNGSFVSLAWSPPATDPSPTSYVLSAGTAPGLSNITVYDTGSTATALGAPAPPGTYYIRAASKNACGTSGPSNEVVLVVP